MHSAFIKYNSFDAVSRAKCVYSYRDCIKFNFSGFKFRSLFPDLCSKFLWWRQCFTHICSFHLNQFKTKNNNSFRFLLFWKHSASLLKSKIYNLRLNHTINEFFLIEHIRSLYGIHVPLNKHNAHFVQNWI